MAVDAAIVGSASALLGALAGGAGTLTAAIYTQRFQDRLQRNAREVAKREAVYAEFISTASAIRISALGEEGLTPSKDYQQLIGILNRLRLFAPALIVAEAEEVIRSLISLAYQPRVDFSAVNPEELEKLRGGEAVAAFSKLCRKDLDLLAARI